MNWLTILLAVLIAGAAMTGFGRGVVIMLVGLVGYVVSLLVAGRYAAPLREALQRSWHTTDRLTHALSGHVPMPREAYEIPASALTYDRMLLLLKSVPLPESYREALAHQLITNPPSNVSVAQYLLHKIAEGMMEAVCFAAIAVVASYLLFWVAQRVNFSLSRVPMIGTMNRLLGAGVGFAEVVVSLSVALGLLAPFFSMKALSGLEAAVGGSHLAQWLISLYPTISKLVFGRAWLFLGL